jgi:hypothetical protein
MPIPINTVATSVISSNRYARAARAFEAPSSAPTSSSDDDVRTLRAPMLRRQSSSDTLRYGMATPPRPDTDTDASSLLPASTRATSPASSTSSALRTQASTSTLWSASSDEVSHAQSVEADVSVWSRLVMGLRRLLCCA